MGQLLLLTIGALVVGAIGFGIAVLISGSDQGLQPVEPDGRAVPLPVNRPLVESDFGTAKFDTAVRGYRMGQVDSALRRAAYDIGYKQELIGVLEAEVDALRDGRVEEADKLRSARQAALSAIADGPRPTSGTPARGDGESSGTTAETTAEAAADEPSTDDAKADVEPGAKAGAKTEAQTGEPDEPDDIIESHGDRNEDADSTAGGRQREMRLP
jgi:DivIVA domain-containing protein